MFKKRFIAIALTSLVLVSMLTSQPLKAATSSSNKNLPLSAHIKLTLDNELNNLTLSNQTLADTLSIKKSWYRSQFKLVSSCGKSIGYTYAAYLLKHSLSDYPLNLFYDNNSGFVSKLKSTNEYKELLSKAQSAMCNTKETWYVQTGYLNVNSYTDLKLAVHGMKYVLNSNLIDGQWVYTIRFSDTYNFETTEWKDSGIKGTLVKYLNNNAASAQKCGAIMPYDIMVTTAETYTPAV